jgi:DNA-binding IclR family transcriptional regulator
VQLVSSVKKAMDILMLFTEVNSGLSLSEISSRIDLHKSSVLRTLSTLTASGIIEKDPENGTYRLGLLVLEMAGKVIDRYDFREQAKPIIAKLAVETGEIIHLSILDGGEIIYLDKRGEAQPLTVATKIWGRHPAHCSAMGKVLLSGLSRDEMEKALGPGPYQRMTRNTITDLAVLYQVLQCVRDDGYAIDDEEAFQGIRCVAAPVVGPDGNILAAISATVPKQRMDRERTMKMCGLIKDAAEKISVCSIAGHID